MGSSRETERKEMEIESNEKIAKQNLGFQKETFEYNKALQQQIFNREDTAYQRTASDMRAAGVSPLAMQGTNGAGEAVAQTAPHNDMQYDYMSGMSTDMEKVSAVLGAIGSVQQSISSIADIQKQFADIQNIKAQTSYLNDTHQSRIDSAKYQAIIDKLGSYSAAQRRSYENTYGLNDGMSKEERLASIVATLLSDEDLSESKDPYYFLKNPGMKSSNLLDDMPELRKNLRSILNRSADGLDRVLEYLDKLFDNKKDKKKGFGGFPSYDDWLNNIQQ